MTENESNVRQDCEQLLAIVKDDEQLRPILMANPMMPSDPAEATKEINRIVSRDGQVFMRLPNGGLIATRKWMRKHGDGFEPSAEAAE